MGKEKGMSSSEGAPSSQFWAVLSGSEPNGGWGGSQLMPGIGVGRPT